MVFSKSFGYAVRGVLYIAIMNGDRKRIQLDEIAEKLTIPRFFLGKIMQKMVKEGILESGKGKHGGFSINEKTLKTTLLKLVAITGDKNEPDSCVLRFRKCNKANPCPMHQETEALRKEWNNLLQTTTLERLLATSDSNFIRSIATT
jgi:Rrf2 family transcriptional regulator, iron-sulfur cluster assembly transcription factor